MAAGNSSLVRNQGYQTADFNYANVDQLTHVSTALAATGNEAGSVDQGRNEVGRFKIVTANVTGTVNVKIQTSQDNSTWVDATTTGAIGAATTYLNTVLARYVRIAWVIVTGPADVTVTGDLI